MSNAYLTASSSIALPLGPTDGGTGQDSYTKGDILYSDATNSLAKLPVSQTPGVPLIQVDDNVQWFNPDRQYYLFEDFICTAINDGFGVWGRVAGSGGTIQFISVLGHPGVVSCKSGGSVNGVGGIECGTVAFLAGGGRLRTTYYAKLDHLSDATDAFTSYIGNLDKGSPSFNAGAWFEYTHSANSGDWVLRTQGFGNNTVNTSTTADTDWHKYTIDINAAGTSVSFYIDDVEVSGSPLTTSPTASDFAPIAVIVNNSGGAEGVLLIDAAEIFVDLTSSRF